MLRKFFSAFSSYCPRGLKNLLKNKLSLRTSPRYASISKGKTLTFDKIKAMIKKDELGCRPYHSLCLLYATLEAQKLNLSGITVIELGVARGGGILNLCEVSSLFAKATGIDFCVYGFDTGAGLPEIIDYRDHPEIWARADFQMGDREELVEKVKSYEPHIKTDIIFGNVNNTLPDFIRDTLSVNFPIGVICVDIDLYSSTKQSLQLLNSNAECYLPATLMYVDDTESLLTYNSRCGEKLAINEFNAEQNRRFIEKKLVRRNFPRKQWHERIYVCHVFDHPVRTGKKDCTSLEINIEHY